MLEFTTSADKSRQHFSHLSALSETADQNSASSLISSVISSVASSVQKLVQRLLLI